MVNYVYNLSAVPNSRALLYYANYCNREKRKRHKKFLNNTICLCVVQMLLFRIMADLIAQRRLEWIVLVVVQLWFIYHVKTVYFEVGLCTVNAG